MPFTFTRLPIPGLVLIEAKVLEDDRGLFSETYRQSDFIENGITASFCQDNYSLSKRGVVRGLHFQRAPHEQAKVIRVAAGAVWDVAVDLRSESPSFRQWYALELSAGNRRMLFMPEGFAHGFQSLADGTELVYKCSSEYHKESDGGVRWNDPQLGIEWPLRDAIISARDAALPWLKDLS